MKVTINLTVLLVLGMGCRQEESRLQSISHEEYVVYWTALQALVDSSRHYRIVVHDSTLRNDPNPQRTWAETTAVGERVLHFNDAPPFSYTPRSIPDQPQFSAEEFRQEMESINQKSSWLDPDSFRVFQEASQSIRETIGSAEIDQLSSEGRVFKLWVSRVAFSKSKDQAVIYTEYWCGGLCGAGVWIWLKQSANTWRVEKKVETWVS